MTIIKIREINANTTKRLWKDLFVQRLTCDVLKELVQHPYFPIVGQGDSRSEYKLTPYRDYPYRHFPMYVPFPLNMENA